MDHRRIALPTGVDLDVWSAGDPTHPPILFLHGFPESHRTWRHQMAVLAADHYVIAPDQRGFARSSKPINLSDYTPDKMVADLFALADALGLTRFTLAAHDWGGALGWAAALKRPERVARLIIANAPHPYIYQKTIIEDLDQRQACQYIRIFRGEELEKRIAQNGLEWFFDHSFMRHLKTSQVPADDRAAYLDEWSQPGALTAMFNWYRASPIDVPAMDAVIETTAFLQNPFPKLMVPTLVIWGMKDPALLPCQLDGLEALVADLTIAPIDCGHFTPWEAPEAVTSALRNFLEARPV